MPPLMRYSLTFLCERARTSEIQAINLRTSQMGYDLARTNPDTWEALLEKLVPQSNARTVLEDLAQSDLSVEEQSREFNRLTGLSRRTFFKYRKKAEPLDLSGSE